ncbi:hypothetical protein LSH36_3g07019 [Paralvinella palmiformis]|uniref:AMP-dependent synthetase/ligase domain-containing protein n=1 Tax=Paralvinella palmiformis TaxID=53620 RepID=A0AAD9KFS6_9ANNE|nr:hypothetical protein LSH36_3g07019 [Paralvinella palmiformis]
MENTLSLLQGERAAIPECRLPDLFASHAISIVNRRSAAVINSNTGETLSFTDLDRESDVVGRRLFALLQSLGYHDDITDAQPVVGLYLMPSSERIIALLALFKINAVVLPLDVAIPSKRMRLMLQRSRAVAVVSSETEPRADELRSLSGQLGIVYLDYFQSLNKEDGGYFACADQQLGKVFNRSEPNPYVSVFYTSGSTGEPRGVCHRTNNWLNLVTSYWRDFPFREGDVGCHKTPIAFVESLHEILVCLLGGVPLVVVSRESLTNPEALMRIVDQYKVSHIGMVPSMARAIARICDVSPALQDLISSLRVVACNSEVLDPELAKRLKQLLPYDCILANMYGSTEDTGDVTKEIFRNISNIDQQTINGTLSVGKPLLNTNIYILDGKKRILEPGQTGTIYVSGSNVTDGYIDDSPSDCFVANPFTKWHRDHKIYNTGDQGFVMDGRLFFIGRTDGIVKVRGQRVSCFEIERMLAGSEHLDKSIVIPIYDAKSLDSTRLVAFCTRKSSPREKRASFSFSDERAYFSMSVEGDIGAREELGPVDDVTLSSAVEAYCRLNLPAYMVPTVVVLDEFPLKPLSGKIDADALRRKYLESKIPADRVSEGSIGGEEEILRIIASELQMSYDCLQKNMAYRFLDLGGNSLSAVSVVLALRAKRYCIAIDDFIGRPISDLLHIRQLSPTETSTTTDRRRSENSSADVERLIGERFLVKMLNKVRDHETVKRLMALAFTQKNPLDMMMGTTLMDFMVFLNSIWAPIVEDDLSFVVLDRQNRNTVVAASINIRLETELRPEVTMKEVIAINEAVEIPVRARILRAGGRWIDCMLNAVDVSLPNSLGLPLMILMEERVIEMGTSLDLDGIVTVNSHPVTLALAEQRLGYVVENEIHVKSFTYNGQKPFRNADDNYVIKCMTRKLK